MSTESIAKAINEAVGDLMPIDRDYGEDFLEINRNLVELSKQFSDIHHQLERIADHLEATEGG